MLLPLLLLAVVLLLPPSIHPGLNLPRLDQSPPHYGGSWAAAGSGVFTDLFKVCLCSYVYSLLLRNRGQSGDVTQPFLAGDLCHILRNAFCTQYLSLISQ